jgi:hypothetical protein
MIPTLKTNIHNLEEDELERLVGVVSLHNIIISDIIYPL